MSGTETVVDTHQWYRCAGMTITSTLRLDELAETTLPSSPDLVISGTGESIIDEFAAGSTHVLTVGEVDAPWLTVRRGRGGYLARWPGQLDVVIPDDGSRMLVLERGEVADSIARLLLCPALSFVLPGHGREGLHASAVEIDGRAIVFAGRSGFGKSTLATALCKAGGRLLADDLASVRLDEARTPVVDPTSKRVWLVREVASEMVGADAAIELNRAHKVAVGGDEIPRATSAVPLAALYVLSYRSGEPEISVPLERREAMLAFLQSLFNYAIRTPMRLATQFPIAGEVAGRVAIRRLRWDPSPRAAESVVDQILAQLRGDDPAAPATARSIGANGSAASNGSHAGPPAANGARETAAPSERRRLLELLRSAGVATELEDGFDEPLLRTSQVAALLRTSDRTIRTWSDAGKLTYIKTLGGRRLFPASAVMAVMRSMHGPREEA